jgi:hypothetical protein
MKTKLIFNSKFAKLINTGAITLYPFIFFSMSKEDDLRLKVVHHEYVHVRQVRSIGWFKFYLSYFWKWVVALVQQKPINYPNSNVKVATALERAYFNISYEQEAFNQEYKLEFTPAELNEVL